MAQTTVALKTQAQATAQTLADIEVLGQIVDAIHLLSEKYEIPYEEAVEHAEFALSCSLSNSFRADIQVYLKPKCRIVLFNSAGATEIKPSSIDKSAIKKAKQFLEYRFLCLHAHRVYNDAKKLIRTVIFGEIVKKLEKMFYVRFYNPHAVTEGGRVLVGVCPLEHQTPKERGTYREGLKLHFFVTSVRGIVQDGVPKVIITLSRNSISFPEVLLRDILIEHGIFTEIKAVRRIAGAYTEIQAKERLPKECIQKVSHLLNEGIIVKY